ENSRVLKWVVDRIEGRVEADETVAGFTARASDIDLTGLDTSIKDVEEALAIDPEEWRRELPLITEWLEFCGPKVPAEVHEQFAALKERLG
ncbi:MAG: phosphoenolpyruvate carboxykinase domain-containing protein, partial [Dietzia sp.]